MIPEEQQRREKGFRIARTAFITFLSLILLTFFWVVLRPLLPSIVLASLVAVIFFPVHTWVEKVLRGRKVLAALASMGLLSLFIVIPVVSFLALFIYQMRIVLKGVLGADPSEIFTGDFFAKFETHIQWLTNFISQYTDSSIDFRAMGVNVFQAISKGVYTSLPDLLGYTGSLVLAYMVLCIVLFFMLLQGKAIVDLIVELSPMSDKYDRQILGRLASTIQAVFIGALLTSLVQGAIGMVGFLIVGVENAVVWGGVMAFCSLIPVVGTAIIWAPAAIYFWISGDMGSSIVLLVTGGIIALSDNIIRPMFMQGKVAISPLIIFLSLFGGIRTAGAMGLIYGPLLAATVVEALRIYRSDFMIPDTESGPYVAPPALQRGAEPKRRRRRFHRRGRQENENGPEQPKTVTPESPAPPPAASDSDKG